MYRNLNAECARAGVTKKMIANEVLHIQPSTLSIKLKKDDGFKINEAQKIKEYLKSSLTLEDLFKFEQD